MQAVEQTVQELGSETIDFVAVIAAAAELKTVESVVAAALQLSYSASGCSSVLVLLKLEVEEVV